MFISNSKVVGSTTKHHDDKGSIGESHVSLCVVVGGMTSQNRATAMRVPRSDQHVLWSILSRRSLFVGRV
jgi:hypothetical protein